MEKNTIIENLIANHSDPEAEKYVTICLDFIDEIHQLLESKNWTQSDLAKAMGKSPAEISKIINGGHNVTFKTLAKLAVALGEDVFLTQTRAREIYANEAIPVKKVASVKVSIPVYPLYENFEYSGLKVVYHKRA